MLSEVKSGRPEIPWTGNPGLWVPETNPRKRWILVVGSYPLFRGGLSLLIEWRTGFESTQATSLAETRQSLRDLKGRIDLAVVNFRSLEEAGRSVISSIREADVPVLVIAAGRDSEQRFEAQQAERTQSLT
jgi:DNA-binding NarL/FixJ family response regulator